MVSTLPSFNLVDVMQTAKIIALQKMNSISTSLNVIPHLHEIPKNHSHTDYVSPVPDH